MKLNNNELLEKLDELKEIMGAEELLEELGKAMSDKELQENLEFIDRMHDTNLFNEN